MSSNKGGKVKNWSTDIWTLTKRSTSTLYACNRAQHLLQFQVRPRGISKHQKASPHVAEWAQLVFHQLNMPHVMCRTENLWTVILTKPIEPGFKGAAFDIRSMYHYPCCCNANCDGPMSAHSTATMSQSRASAHKDNVSEYHESTLNESTLNEVDVSTLTTQNRPLSRQSRR